MLSAGGFYRKSTRESWLKRYASSVHYHLRAQKQLVMRKMSEGKPQSRKLAAREIRAVPFPGSSQAGTGSVFQPPIFRFQWITGPVLSLVGAC